MEAAGKEEQERQKMQHCNVEDGVCGAGVGAAVDAVVGAGLDAGVGAGLDDEVAANLCGWQPC